MDEPEYVDGCNTCTNFKKQAAAARDVLNVSGEVNIRVRARRHLRTAHGINSIVGSRL